MLVNRVALAAGLFALVACGRPDSEPAPTPLPTKQTTIDPVTKKLDRAAEDVERRRQSVDEAVK